MWIKRLLKRIKVRWILWTKRSSMMKTYQEEIASYEKTCFFWKHISIHHGAKKPTKNIPYTWIFSDGFNLSNHTDFLENVKERNLMYEEA